MDIIQEVSQNFIDSAYDTNTNRAFPDARDGLKPSMRACLWTMYKHGFTHSKPHVKSAKIDGLVAASIWPHGTTAIYETFTRMSQPFTNILPEVDFHGANGNVILGGNSIAADRYSEARLSSMAEKYILAGVEKNAVDMQLNFSEDEEWPTVLPSVFPRLLVNGSQGIGVSIANSWCCHNLTDTVNIIETYIQEGKVDNYHYLPDWPCGATIVNKDELPQINLTGKGKIVTEAKYEIKGKEIHFTEFPFQVYIEPLIEEIKNGIEQDKIHNISEVFNKSDKKQVLLTVTCAKAANIQFTLNELFNFTSLRSQFNVNQVAIVGKTPKLLTLKDMCEIYVSHNISCIKRECQYDLNKTNSDIEILEGLAKALSCIDNLIELIKQSESADSAKKELLSCGFIERQADAILGMKLSRLARLEAEEINSKLTEKQALAENLIETVSSENKQKEILMNRLDELVEKFGDERRTKVINKEIKKVQPVEKPAESLVIAFNQLGYLQSIPEAQYKDNGLKAYSTTSEDYILLFSSLGKCYRLAASDIKQCGNKDKGVAIGTLLDLDAEEAILYVCGNESKNIAIAASDGSIKRIETEQFYGTTRNKNGMAIMKDSSDIISIQECEDDDVITLATKSKQISFAAGEVRLMGKTSGGIRGITANEPVESMKIENENDFTGKLQSRGGKGIKK